MLDWIVMNVIEVPLQFVGIADRVFPKSLLPNAAYALANAGC